MSVKVIQGKINNGIKFYGTDEVIAGLSEKEEARLVSLGVAVLIPEEKKSKEVNPYAGKTAEELIAISEDELKAVYESEQKGKNRKTVFQAIQAKMEAMNDLGGQANVDPDGLNGDGIGLNFNPDDLIK